MRLRSPFGILVAATLALPLGVVCACGGASAPAEPPKSAETEGPPSASASEPASAPVDAGATTTTTPPAGDPQGVKLQETTSAPAASGSAAPTAAAGGHRHEPGRGPADIRAIVMAHRDEARACYDRGLKDHPGIEGDLVIQWTIDPKGNVVQASADTSRSQIMEPTVIKCVGDIIKKIQFAASPGGFETKAFYPFNFHPKQGQAPNAH